MTDERNFRSHYYGKIALRETEEKRTLEHLLLEQPVDLGKLAAFASCFVVPVKFRRTVWKLLLGILPRYTCSKDYVRQQHVLMYEDLWNGLHALGLQRVVCLKEGKGAYEATSTDSIDRLSTNYQSLQVEHLLFMWLLSNGHLLIPTCQGQLATRENELRLQLAKKLHYFCEDDKVDAFLLFSALWSMLASLPHASVSTETSLLIRGENEPLFLHLSRLGFMACPFFANQSSSLFGAILPEMCVEIVLDKVVAGTWVFLSFVAAALVLQRSKVLMTKVDLNEVIGVLSRVSGEEANRVMSFSLDLWYRKHGKRKGN